MTDEQIKEHARNAATAAQPKFLAIADKYNLSHKEMSCAKKLAAITSMLMVEILQGMTDLDADIAASVIAAAAEMIVMATEDMPKDWNKEGDEDVD